MIIIIDDISCKISSYVAFIVVNRVRLSCIVIKELLTYFHSMSLAGLKLVPNHFRGKCPVLIQHLQLGKDPTRTVDYILVLCVNSVSLTYLLLICQDFWWKSKVSVEIKIVSRGPVLWNSLLLEIRYHEQTFGVVQGKIKNLPIQKSIYFLTF